MNARACVRACVCRRARVHVRARTLVCVCVRARCACAGCCARGSQQCADGSRASLQAQRHVVGLGRLADRIAFLRSHCAQVHARARVCVFARVASVGAIIALRSVR